LFTADPPRAAGTWFTDATFGLREALVSGLVSPDLHKVDKRRNQIIEKKIA
jgi:pyruvate,water dikinase